MIKLGQRLHDQRIRKGLTIDDVTRATKIRPAFLSAIERGEYYKLPASAYAQGFIANYAEYLGLSRREALALFRREFDEVKTQAVIPQRFAEPADQAFSRMKIQHTTVIVVLAFAAFLAYIGFSFRDAFIDPSLTTTIAAMKGAVTVQGKANPYDTVTVNAVPVYINTDGSFTKTIPVFPGKAQVLVQAVNRFGRSTSIQKVVEITE